MKRLVKLIGWIFVCAIISHGANANILPEPRKISEHVYAWIGPLDGPNAANQGYRMNMAFVVGTESVAVIDTGYTSAMAEEMIAHIKKITPLPVKYAISTSSQPHRHFGNDAFAAAGAEIISSPEEVARMKDMGGMFATISAQLLELEEGAIEAPDAFVTTITETRGIKLGGGVTITVSPVGANHTPNSLIVAVPLDKVVYAGDILYSGRLLAILNISNTGEWIEAYDQLRKYPEYTFIPGHGEPAPLDAFELPTYSYLTKMWDYMCKAVESGTGIDEAVKSYDQSTWAKLVNFDELSGRNASWAYQQAELACF